MFYNADFVFDNVPSETYGLKIGFFDSQSLRQTMSGLTRSVEEYKLKRKSKPLFFGVTISGKIEFDLTLYSEDKLDTYDRQAIDNWLYKSDYCFFNIIEEDYQNVFFNCIITESTKIEIGSIPYAKSIHVVCDDAYAYTNEYTYNFTSTSTPSTVKINNIGTARDYLYPADMTITMNGSGDCKITNVTESNRLFEIESLADNEVITIDSDSRILESTYSSDRVGNFNKKWLRLVPYTNTLALEGNFDLEIKTRFKVTI